MCTYCGQRTHTAAYCPRRCVSGVCVSVFALLSGLAGCATTPPSEPVNLLPPSAEVMADCPNLPEIPRDEYRQGQRAKYYAVTRTMYAKCRDEKRFLRQWIVLVTTR